jgi:hypothetical protein
MSNYHFIYFAALLRLRGCDAAFIMQTTPFQHTPSLHFRYHFARVNELISPLDDMVITLPHCLLRQCNASRRVATISHEHFWPAPPAAWPRTSTRLPTPHRTNAAATNITHARRDDEH